MDSNLQRSIWCYLGDTIAVHPAFSEWAECEKLPQAIRAAYSFGTLKLLGHSYVTLTAKGEAEASPAVIAKHLAWIDERFERRGIFVAEALEAFNRKRLVEHKVPFIVPGNQLYLPDLGIDFREHLRKARQKKSYLSPSAQMVFLGYLLRRPSVASWTATGLAGAFDASKMTMSRAIDDLEGHGLVEVRPEWREKRVHFKGERKDLWKIALPQLRSPVQKRIFIEWIDLQAGMVAGQSALSQRTMIADVNRKVRAITGREWKDLQKARDLRIIPAPAADQAPIELEIWRYDPKPLSSEDFVDDLSLYLSLTDEHDERTEAELEQLLETLEW